MPPSHCQGAFSGIKMMEDETLPDSLSRQLEWEAFRSLALTAVRTGFIPKTTDGEHAERLFQIVELPSFDTVTGWEIFRITARDANESSRYILARTRWEQKQDVGMFYHPIERLTMLRLKYLKRLSPALTFTMHLLRGDNAREVENASNRLLSTPVPLLLAGKRFGLDGTSYELGVGDSWAGVRFHWWEQTPPEWTILGETVMPLLKTLEGLIAEEAK